MSADTATVDCPREDLPEGEDCQGTVAVTLEYEPADRNYGCDRDGNRGVSVAGYWTAEAADACSLGHVLTDEEKKDIQKDAENDAAVDQEDEYWGPDGPDDDY